MADYTISISVDANGNFTYCPSVLRVDLTGTDNVTWNCLQGPFSVGFKDQTPLEQLGAPGTKNGEGWSTGKIKFKKNAAPGHYHYGVAVFAAEHVHAGLMREERIEDRAGLVHMDIACPEIIVN